MFEYNFSNEDIEKCKDFANKIDTSFYSSRSQTNNEKRKKDQIVGKLGELLSYYYLKDKLENLSYPDFNIYDKKNKSWDFDLKATNYNIHVKSQDIVQAAKYEPSWLFQAGGNFGGYDKEIFDKLSQNQYICFCVIDLKNVKGNLKSIVKLEHLHDNNLFKPPKLDKLKFNNKLAVYLKDLGELNML